MTIRFAESRDIPGMIDLLRQVGQVHHQIRPDIFRADAQKYGPSQVLAMLEKSEWANIIFDFQNSFVTIGGANTIPNVSTDYIGKSVFINLQYEGK